MDCIKPIRLFNNIDRNIYPDGLLVGCGKCLMCRIQKRREWSMRMLHELGSHKNSVFLTLTYCDEKLPEYGSLQKKHLQQFFKSLRQLLKRNGDERKIRYFACGEYGEQTQRPHYHAIIFGMSLYSLDKSYIMKSWPYTDWSVQSIQKKAFGLVEPDSIRYVAQYIDKKFTGDLAKTEYTERNREPVFRLMSLGLGRDYADQHALELAQRSYITVNGIKYSIPRYYLNRLSLDNGVDYAIEKELDIVQELTGKRMSFDDAYKLSNASDWRSLEEKYNNSKQQKEDNVRARSNLKRSKL